MKINVKELKNALSKVNKLIDSNKIMEICKYVELLVSEGTLIITVTDKTYTITSRVEVDTEEKLSKVVEGSKLVKLIKSLNSEFVEFNFKDKYLEIKSNGKYKLDYYNDEFPSYEIEPQEVMEVDAAVLQEIVAKHKGTPSTDLEVPVLTGYYIGEEVLTLDGTKMAITKDKLLSSELLIPADLMEMVNLFEEEDLKIMVDDNKLLFDSDSLTIFGSQLYGIGDFPDLSTYKDASYENHADIETAALKEVLNRIEIFTDPMGNKGLHLESDGEKLLLSDLKGKSKEELEVEGEGSFACNLVIDDLILFVKNTTSDTARLMCDGENLAFCLKDNETEYFTGKLVD